MVKISELSDSQLLSQLTKYEKLLRGLIKERKNRIDSGKSTAEKLMTPYEKKRGNLNNSVNDLKPKQKTAPAQAQAAAGGIELKESNDNDFSNSGFELDTQQLQEMQAMQESKSKSGANEEDDDEVQVTTLLNLSKEQLDSLKTGMFKKTKKK